MSSDDPLARALKAAALSKALATDTGDLFEIIAARLGISPASARKLGAVLLDSMTASIDDPEPTLH
jgi:hypothetical protein